MKKLALFLTAACSVCLTNAFPIRSSHEHVEAPRTDQQTGKPYACKNPVFSNKVPGRIE